MPTYEKYIQYAGIRWNRIKQSEKASLWTYTKRMLNEHKRESNVWVTYS